MELSEATALADTFITSLVLSVWRLPLTKGAQRDRQGAQIDEAALEAARRHLGNFSVRDKISRSKGESLHLTISARTIDRQQGRCPALVDKLCGIYETRPNSCRAVPLHFSQPLSQLGPVLDNFVRRPGHLCDTSSNAPVLLDGTHVLDPSIQQAREDALKVAREGRGWKKAILSLMDDADAARKAGLPTYDAVVHHSELGRRATVSMLAAWRVARDARLIPPQVFAEICAKQIALIRSELGQGHAQAGLLAGMLAEYEQASAQARG